MFQNGNLLVYTAFNLVQPIWNSKTAILGAVKACSEVDGIKFYNSANVVLTGSSSSVVAGNNGASLIPSVSNDSVVSGISKIYSTLTWPNRAACRDELRVPIF
jgi:hypothetical protein